MRIFVLHKTIDKLVEFHFSFRNIRFFAEKCIFAQETEIPGGVSFFLEIKRLKKLSIAL